MDKINENRELIMRICYSFCSSRADREDLFQDIVYRILRSYSSFDGRSSFSTWLYRVGLNTAITFTKKKGRHIEFRSPVAEEQEWINPADKVAEIETLYRAIGKLNRVDRAIIHLYLEERSYEEIAEITGFSVKNISVKIVRIKRKLQGIFLSLI